MPVPLLPVDLLRIPLFSLSICTSICSFCAQMLAMVSLPFFLQSMMGRSEVETGLLLTPWPLATMVMAPLAGYLIEKVHAGLLGAMGCWSWPAACSAWLCCPPRLPIWILSGAWRSAAGFGLFQSPNNHTIVSSAPAIAAAAPAACWGPRACLGRAPAPRWCAAV
jgi:DHA2 family multidrug resistance protein-like MFS transporter